MEMGYQDAPEAVERLAYPIPFVVKALGLCRNGVYQAVKTGQTPSIRVGNRILIPAWYFKKLRNGQANTGTAP
jgi:hypothetical protein